MPQALFTYDTECVVVSSLSPTKFKNQTKSLVSKFGRGDRT
jgi:hypothetical protein